MQTSDDEQDLSQELPGVDDSLPPRAGSNRHGLRTLLRRYRRLIAIAIFFAAIVGFIIFVLPQITGLSHTLYRLRHAEPSWIVAGVILETMSLAGYIFLFRAVFSCQGVDIGWRESYQINMAGTVASKLLATAGAGGVALTVWALRAAGLEARAIARRMLTFELLLYTVFAGSMVVVGIGLRIGVFSGPAPWTLTVIPAAIGAGVILFAVALRALPADAERRLRSRADSGRTWRLLSRLAAAPDTLRESTSVAVQLLRQREFGVLGALAYWGFDIATLWASLHAFGNPPPFPTIVMCYFLGQLGNILPLPGGVGGVEGGMIGALIAFGTSASLALLGVLLYRLISFWLPTLPGGLAYLRLRRTVEQWRGRGQAPTDPLAADPAG